LNQKRFAWSGTLKSQLPSIDILSSQLIWSVYLPNDFTYHYFDSSLEKEEIIQGINVFAKQERRYNEKAMKELYQSAGKKTQELKQEQFDKIYKGKNYRSNFQNVPIQQDGISRQLNAELEFSGQLSDLNQQKLPQASLHGAPLGTGIMPIQIKIPTSGQVYRFAKTIVKGNDPLNFKVIYSRNQVSRIAKWFILIIITGFLYLIRKKLLSRFTRIYDLVKKHKETIKTSAQSKMMPFILFGLMITIYFISTTLSLLVFFFFWISAVYQIVLYQRKKIQFKNKPESFDL